jgi:hypothetical protein
VLRLLRGSGRHELFRLTPPLLQPVVPVPAILDPFEHILLMFNPAQIEPWFPVIPGANNLTTSGELPHLRKVCRFPVASLIFQLPA